MNNLIFIGGIHGAGKGTICRKVCEQTDLVHITASEVLKWREISDVENKKVMNIPDTQIRLIEGLKKIKKEKGNYLLDGHFCLFNSESDVEKIQIETFELIAPKLVAVVVTKIKTIQKRLRSRDNTSYSPKTLEYMQSMEVCHAAHVASTLNVPFIEIRNDDTTELIESYHHKLNLTNG